MRRTGGVSDADGAVEIAERVLRQNWLEGERDGVPLRLHAAEPRPLPVAVVLGLLLRGDRLAALRPGARAGRAGEPARRPAPGRLHRPHDLLGPAGLADPAALLQRRSRAAPSRPRRSSRRCSPGPGGSRSATRPRSRGSRAQMDWLAANRDLEGDGLLWIVQPDESGLDASPKFDPVWGRRANARIGFPLPGPPQPQARLRRPPDPRARRPGALRGRSSTRSGRSRCRRWGGPRRRRRWSSGSGTSAAALFLDEVQPGGERPRGPHLGGAGAAGPARPARGDRPAPGRGAPARTAASSSPRSRRPRSPPRSRATSRAAAAARSAATGAARPGSTRPGWSGSACGGSATTRRRARAGRRPDRRGRARRPARVLRPARRHRPRRQGLRLVGADRRDGRPRVAASAAQRAICSGR